MTKVADEILTNTNLVSQIKVKEQTDTHIDILDGFRGLAILLVLCSCMATIVAWNRN